MVIVAFQKLLYASEIQIIYMGYLSLKLYPWSLIWKIRIQSASFDLPFEKNPFDSI